MSRDVPSVVQCYVKFRGSELQPTTPEKCVFGGILGPFPDPKVEKWFVGVGGKIKKFGSTTRIWRLEQSVGLSPLQVWGYCAGQSLYLAGFILPELEVAFWYQKLHCSFRNRACVGSAPVNDNF